MFFQRFTSQARWLVKDATAEAERRGDSCVGTEHLLIAVAASPLTGLAEADLTRERIRAALNQVDAEALGAIGIVIDPADTAPPTPRGRTPRHRHLPFTQEVKNVLAGALEEATVLGERHLGPLHIALALTQIPPTSPARRVLERLDVDPLELRRRLLDGRDQAA